MFEVTHTDGEARTGFLYTNQGKIKTPFYMPVATKATVKAMTGPQVEKLGFESIISNSFMLSQSPGVDIIEENGTLHDFMRFHKNIFTDSGGFQVLSKHFLHKKTEKGVWFKDKSGKKHLYTPELAMENQLRLGADVAMTLDDVAHFDMNGQDYVHAIKRTNDWARRALEHHKLMKKEYGKEQLLFGICQGGTDPLYRRFSTHKINEMGFDGVALGGLVIGESRKELIQTISLTLKHFDKNKIKYLMGLGSPPDIIRAIAHGVDCFDSVFPTSNARHGSLITRKGRINIMNAKFKKDFGPIEEGCTCETCTKFSKSYVQHLLKNKEILGYHLATVHNLHFMNKMILDARLAIEENRYKEFANQFLTDYFSGKESKEFNSQIKNKYTEKKKQTKPVYLIEHFNHDQHKKI